MARSSSKKGVEKSRPVAEEVEEVHIGENVQVEGGGLWCSQGCKANLL